MAHFVLAILKEYVKMRQILEVIENEINLLFLQKKPQNKATTMRKKKRQFQRGFVSRKYVTGRFLETLISEKDPFC